MSSIANTLILQQPNFRVRRKNYINVKLIFIENRPVLDKVKPNGWFKYSLQCTAVLETFPH